MADTILTWRLPEFCFECSCKGSYRGKAAFHANHRHGPVPVSRIFEQFSGVTNPQCINVMIKVLRPELFAHNPADAVFRHIQCPGDIADPQIRLQILALLLQSTPNGNVRFDVKNGQVLRRELRFDNYVLGAVGPDTMLTAKGKTVEVLLPKKEVAQLAK